jgi:hypothetical protein
MLHPLAATYQNGFPFFGSQEGRVESAITQVSVKIKNFDKTQRNNSGKGRTLIDPEMTKERVT